MLLYLQNYDVTISYQPHKEMLVADALSCHAPPDAPDDDPLLPSFAGTILADWPEDINDVPCFLHSYQAHHNILVVKDCHILHGKALIIPLTERDKALQAIHEGHLGIMKCKYHVWQCVYWP